MRSPPPNASPAKTQDGRYLVATSSEAVYLRVVGLGTMRNCVAFKRFADEVRAGGCDKFVIDLAQCQGFDSTFMGVLLGLVFAKTTVVVINVSPQHRELLRGVGLHRLLRLCDSTVETPEFHLKELEIAPASAASRARVMLSAHENLAKVDRRNEEKFGTFIRALREDLGGDAQG